MQRGSPFDVQSGIILRQHVLPVRLFTHLDVRHGVPALLEVSQFGSGIVGSVIEKCDRNHGGKPAGHAAGEKQIESDLGLRC
jgi:hypothetical protein